MADKSSIEWTDASWTPIRARNTETGKVGWHCVHKSDGCKHCYAERMNLWQGTGLPFKPGLVDAGKVELFLDEDLLLQPLRWKKPRMIFVCSMTDLFADFVPVAWIDRLFGVMALCPQHTFQVLTKRSDRMRQYLTSGWQVRLLNEIRILTDVAPNQGVMLKTTNGSLPNVWLGTSAENQATADERIPHLLATPAWVRFVSAEPLLGPIDLGLEGAVHHHPANVQSPELDALVAAAMHALRRKDDVAGIDWVIVGGESGKQARPMHPDWARSLRDQCRAAGVAFFFKQWGEWAPAPPPVGESFEAHRARGARDVHGWPDGAAAERIGKKAAGRLLDGVQHDGMPA